MKKFLTILLLLATMFPFAAKADQLTVNDGTTMNSYIPLYGYYADVSSSYAEVQFIIPKEGLTSMTNTVISGLTFYANYNQNFGNAKWNVYIEETSYTTLSSAISHAGSTPAYSGNMAIASNQLVITFDNQYSYGGENLLISFTKTQSGTCSPSSSNKFYGVTASNGASGYVPSGSSFTKQAFLPKVTFDYYVPSLEVAPTALGTRPNGAWMEPVTVEVGGGVYGVTGMDIDNDYFTFNGPHTPFTTPASFTVTTGSAASGLVNGTLTFMYNDGKAVKQFTMTATAYDPTAGDVVERATVVSNPVNYTNTPTGIYHNYNLPGEASNGADAVYKLTFASDVMLDANVGAAAGGKVALYPEGFNGEGGPMATNNYEYNGPQVGPGPRNFWFSYPYTGSNTFFGSSTSGMIFGYELTADVIAENELAGLTLMEVESAAYEAYPYDLIIMTGSTQPENLVYYQPMGTAAVSMSFFNLPLSEPYVLGNENTWILFMTDSPYSAYCGKNLADVRGQIWYSQDLATWYSSSTYTPEIACHFLEIPTGREMSMNLADMTVKANFAGGAMAEATAAVNGTSKAAAFNARKSNTRETLTYNFDDGTLQGWTAMDADGDSYNWRASESFASYSGSYAAVSESYRQALSPDNYLISPQLTLGAGASISFYEATYYGYEEPIYLMVSTTGTNPSDFTSIQNWTFSNTHESSFEQQTVDLSAYAGQQVYLAFRHYGSYDQYAICIDDITIDLGGSEPEPGAGMYVPAGTYYLVAQATEPFTTSINATAALAPEQAVVLYPTDGTMNVESPVLAEWILGNYTSEMQILVGSQYPPQTALIDWTSELVESAFITDLLPNTTYFMQVNERNNSGVTMGEIIGFTTAFEKPVVAVATPYLYPGDAAMLSWEMDRSFRGYNVYVDGERWNEELVVEDEYAVEGLAYDSHTINVTAVYDEGESAYSNNILVNMTGFGHVAGTVFEQDGTTPIEGAAVKFIGTDAFGFDQTFTFTTAANGTFAGDIYEGSYDSQAELEGYQVTPGNHVNMGYDQTVSGLVYNMFEEYKPVGQVNSEITADNKANVWWDWAPATVIEDFEHDGEMPEGWNQVGSYGWEVTTNAPYEGTYCIKSSNAGVASSTGAIEVTVEVPYDAKMSFYVKPSSESNYDKFFFYIDGAEKFNTSGAGSWTKKEYNVSAGTHTYKWAYTKDSSVNSNDDCIYVDYVTLFEKVQPEPPFAGGWIQYDDGTYASSVGTGSAGSNVYWAVCWPNASAYNGLSMTKAALYDAYAGAYTVNIYEGGTDAPQTLIGTTIINGSGSSAMVEGTFSTPISIDGSKSLWIVGVCNQLEYPMAGCSYVGDPNSDLLSLDGTTWEHAADYSLSYSWMLRGYLQSAKGDMVVLDAAERAPQNIVRPEITFDYGTPSTGTFSAKVAETPVYVGVASNYTRGEANNTRSFQSFNVYLKNVLTDEYSKITSTADTTYVHAQWSTLPAGVYQYGVSATYAGNRGDRSVLTVNDGTDNNQYIPVFGYCNDGVQENQFIIPASQIAAMNGSNITSMTLYLTAASDKSWDNEWNITLMETSATTLSEVMNVTAGTTVTTTILDPTSAQITITFDTPFTYNGGNLLVDFESLYEGQWTTTYFYGVQTTSNTSILYYYDAWQDMWISNPQQFLPKVTFTYEGGAPTPTGDGESEIVWADPMDNNMEATVEVSAVTNNGQSAAGTVVRFENMIENLSYEATLDETGFVSFADFRKGYYTMSVELAGYTASMGGDVEIFEDKTYNVTLTEVIAPAEGLFASATGWVMWDNIGGDIPTPGEGDEFFFDFETGFQGWTSIDADGDGFDWRQASTVLSSVSGHDGSADFVFSQSYDNNFGVLYPDNYIVSPQKYRICGTSEFSIWACGQDVSYAAEHFGVAISEGSNTNEADFVTIAQWTIGQKTAKGNDKVRGGSRDQSAWIKYTADLSAYAGKEVWIAVRHFDCYDNYFLDADDFSLSITGSKDRSALHSIVMLDGVVAGQATGNWFQLDTDNLVEGQEYEVSVASVYTTGMSEWRTTTFTYYSCENFKPGVKNLASEVQGVNDVKLTWTLPGGGGSGDEFSFAFDNDLEGWTNIDGDGDGHVFYHSNEASNHGTLAVTSHSGAGHVMGESYCNASYAALTPNDFFVTPQQYNIGASSMLSFWACTQDVNYAAEHFGVAISTTGNTSASDFTTIAEWTLTAKEGFKGPRATDGSREGAWYEYTCDLSEYAGQAAWIAIRHFNCSDQFIMCLDDVAMNNADGKQGNNREMWDYVTSFSCTSAGQQAVATDGEFIYTASWQATPTGGYTFYKYDLEGTFIEGFDISGATGIRDLTFDGEYFYGSSGASQLFILDLANKTKIGQINCSGATSRHCTYDPVRDAFWVGNWSDLALYDRSGAMIQSAPSPSSAYGSGYFQEEDGTEHLYLFCQPNSDALVYDYNITTGQLTGPVMDFSQTPAFNAGISGGSFVGQYGDKICWFGNAQQDPNLVGIYELAEGQPIIEGDFLGAMIFRDGELITPEPLMANQMVDANVAEGEHEYMARLAFGNAELGVLDTMWYAMSCPIFATVNVEIECTPVSELEAEYEYNADGTYGVNLEWICTGADIQGYKVYRNNSYIGMTTTMSYYDERTNNPGEYTYGVVAVYDYCESDMVTVEVTVTDVEENSVIEGIYPNPTNGILNINATAMQQITVVNALGQVVINVEVSGDQTTIDMSGFEAGVYMVTVRTENGSSVKRISVIK